MKWESLLLCSAGAALIAAACVLNPVECDEECEEYWMDGGRVDDSDGIKGIYLLSKRFPNPSSDTLNIPVIIAVHNFTASTFEWEEFRVWAESTQRDSGGLPKAWVSPVLLGGHGRDSKDFRDSKWEDWGRPILEEYDSLVERGYTNISFACASTGGTLLMQSVQEGVFDSRKQFPNWIFLIDPIIVPTSRLLTLVRLAGPFLGNNPKEGTALENAHGYVNRPAGPVAQWYELMNRVKNELEDGFRLPPGTRAKVYKAKQDGSADPVSALLIYKGMRGSHGDHIEAEMMDTRKHVFTRLSGRGSATRADTLLRDKTFLEMTDKAMQIP